MNLYSLAIPTFTQMLRALSGQLAKGEAFSRESGAGPAGLIDLRLAPDMFPLSDQVRFACHQAAETVGRLTGEPSRDRPETAATFEALQALIAETLAQLEATPASAFDSVDQRLIDLHLPNGLVFEMTGEQFLRDWGLAQFYFHLVTAYAILRHAGVALGKADYVPHTAVYIRR